MRRIAALLMLVLMIAAACGDSEGDGEAVPSPTDAPAATEAPAATDAPEATDAGTGVAITEVVFGENGHVTLTNTGSDAVSLDGMWLCNRPQYFALSGSLEPGESRQIPASDIPPLTADGGDIGLYSDSQFGSAEAIVDYVAWGGGGGRLSVAVAGGIWPDGDAVAGGGASITAPGGGASAADWSSS